jgi:hypothetical protein
LRSYVQSVVVVAASQNIDREFLQMRRHVREFPFTGDPDAATAAMASAVRMKVAIEKDLAVATSPERSVTCRTSQPRTRLIAKALMPSSR